MKKEKIFIYLGLILLFIIASLAYFSPVLQGKKLSQSDITQFQGMVKEINDYRAEENKEPYWTGASFSGMPAYQISAYYPNDFVRLLDKSLRFLPRPADYTFLYFLSFFILMMSLKVDWRLATLGALGFGFSTYLIIIFIPGHNAKAHAIAYMPMLLAGVLWIFQKKYLLGFLITSISMALEVYSNHIQMTYYLGFCLFILGFIEFLEAIKNKRIKDFSTQVLIILFAIFIGIGTNAPRLLSMKEYADYSTRGKSELTISPDGSKKEIQKGLDKNYITQYSYAKLETFNLFVPRYMGGGTVETLGKSSDFYKLIEQKAGKKVADDYSKQVLTYWGDQPIVEAPAYIGAIIFFLFFLGVFMVKGKLKNWLVSATLFSIILSWGRNFEDVTNFFIDYIPLYDKFRAVSSIQVIAELCVPILGILALKEFFSSQTSKQEKLKSLKNGTLAFSGLIILGFLLAHISSTFEGLRDGNYKELPGLIDAVISDRKQMLLSDTLRSLILVLLTSGFLWMYLNEKLKKNIVILGVGALVLFDLISIDRNYLNSENFKTSKKVENPFIASNADNIILEDKTHFRVGNFTVDPMQDGATSYFHQSIGGYHAAKMGRYQELFDYQIAKNNMEVLNMLNTKYFIVADAKGNKQAQLNSDANGNVWFVDEINFVNSANEEITLLDSLKTKKKAVLDVSKLETQDNFNFQKDSSATIKLINYNVTNLKYESKSSKDQFAVFSEIYYKDGWNAYIDGQLTPHYRVNYVLRGMKIPAGEHKIEFKFEPKVIQRGGFISIISYSLLLLISIGWFLFNRKRNIKE